MLRLHSLNMTCKSFPSKISLCAYDDIDRIYSNSRILVSSVVIVDLYSECFDFWLNYSLLTKISYIVELVKNGYERAASLSTLCNWYGNNTCSLLITATSHCDLLQFLQTLPFPYIVDLLSIQMEDIRFLSSLILLEV